MYGTYILLPPGVNPIAVKYIHVYINFPSRFSKNIKFHENQFSGSRVVPYRQTDRLMTQLIVTFRSFAEPPENPPAKMVWSC
jgi:hypothetical protein